MGLDTRYGAIRGEVSYLLGEVDAFSFRELFLDVGEPPAIPPFTSSGWQTTTEAINWTMSPHFTYQV